MAVPRSNDRALTIPARALSACPTDLIDSQVAGYADRVLDAARMGPGMRLVDVGTGDGIVALRAIDRIGPSLDVVLTDISAPLLRRAEAFAAQRGVRDQCTFLQCPANDLGAVATASVDVVTTRAVLAYVADKAAALHEFFRILRPGGRISLCEPVMRDDAQFVLGLKAHIDRGDAGPHDRFLRLLHRWKAAQFPDTEEDCASSPMTGYSERDLLALVLAAGFSEVHMEFHVDVAESRMTSWDAFLGISPHPLAPSLRTILAEQFDAEERAFFESIVRPTVESGKAISTDRFVLISAGKS